MSGDRVYTDPEEPGAPQPGDLVVVVTDGHPNYFRHITGLVGLISEVVRLQSELDHCWVLRDTDSGCGWCAVHSVRWPTPAELAAYQLLGPHKLSAGSAAG